MSLSSGASILDIRRVWKGRGASISSDCLVGVGLGGGGGGCVGVEIRTVENFVETGDAAAPAVSTPTPNMCGAER